MAESKVGGKVLEKDLCKPVEDLLIKNGYTIRDEVNDCDIAAFKDDILLIVELKKNLTVRLLAQAAQRQKMADLVYIAVGKPKVMVLNSKWKDICYLIKRLNLGLILVSVRENKSLVEIPIKANFNYNVKGKSVHKRNSMIKEMSGRSKNLNVGGSTRVKLVTSYREQSIFIACCLEKFGPLTLKKLREIGTDVKKTSSILYKNYYGWFDRVSRGVYKINESGIDGIREYKDLYDYYYSKL